MTENLPPLASSVAEYAEKTVADGLKRELDQEENVVRALPFFASSIGVLMALIGLVHPGFSDGQMYPWRCIAYSLVSSILLCILMVIWNLFHATKKQRQFLPMKETALIEFARELSEYHQQIFNLGTHLSVDDRDKSIISELRQAQAVQLATYAELLRKINLQRLEYRGRMFLFLCAAVVLALLLLLVTMTREIVENTHATLGVEDVARRTGTGPQTAGSPPGTIPATQSNSSAQAGSAGDAGVGNRSVDSQRTTHRSGGGSTTPNSENQLIEQDEPVRLNEMSDPKSPPPPPVKPISPPMQPVDKGKPPSRP